MADDKLKVSFAPFWVDKFYCALLILTGAMAAFISGRLFYFPPMSRLQCHRSSAICTDASGYLFGTTEFSMPLDKMKESRVVPGKGSTDEYRWVVTTDKGDAELGNLTSNEAQVENYRRLASDLQAFLNDPSRETFSAEYFSMGVSKWLLLLVAMGALIWALWWIHGWRAELCFDNATETLTIHEQPTLFFGPGKRIIPISEVSGVDLSVTNVFALRVLQRYATVTIRGNPNRNLFVYRIPLTNKKVGDSVTDRVQAMRAFLSGRTR